MSQTEKFSRALQRLGTLQPDAPLGVLDIGSNSVRLVGYSGSARTPLPIYNERAFCRLGEAVSASGRIEGEPYELAMMTFRRFRAMVARLGIENLAAFATAAVRDATNADEFLTEAETVLGHKIRVLSGEEEAVLSADGVMLAMPGADGIVADLGGGSLELARVAENKTRGWATLPLGVLALRERSQNDRARMAEMVEQALSQVGWLAEGVFGKPLYIVGGNWRGLAKLHMERTHYGLAVLHHYQVGAADMQKFVGETAALSEAETEQIDAGSHRRRNMPIAALVLKNLLARVQPSEVIVSANAVREGMLYSILKKKFRRLDPLLLACEEMAERLCKVAAYGHELAGWSKNLFADKTPRWTSAEELERLRQAGCLISDMAWDAHPNFRAAVVSHAVLTAPFVGIDHRGRAFLAKALAFRHEVAHEREVAFGNFDFDPQDVALAKALGLSFRLAHSLSASLPGMLPQTRLQAEGKKLRLEIDPAQKDIVGPIIEKRLAAVADELGLQAELKVR